MALVSRLFFSASVRSGNTVRTFYIYRASLRHGCRIIARFKLSLQPRHDVFCADIFMPAGLDSIMSTSLFHRLLWTFLLLFQAAQGFAAGHYWLPDARQIAPEQTSPTNVRLIAFTQPPASSTWISRWTGGHPTERWSEEASRLIVKYQVNPLRSIRMLTLVHVAMHDAGFRAEHLGLDQTALAAATHVAASNMLAHFFPLEPTGRLEAMGMAALAALTADNPVQASEISEGAAIGRGVARLAILRALHDGADEVWDLRTRPIAKPGMWHGVPPLDSAHPQEPLAGTWKTWVLKNGAEFHPPAPPSPDSEIFLRASQEVLQVARNLTADEKRIAAYWHLDQGTVTPPGLWNRKARALAGHRNLTEKERLRLLSTLNVAMFDASIACWNAKYTWWVQRPATAIRERMDPAFMPYLVTPPHPSYVSGHATVSGAAAEILKRFFPDDAVQIDAWAEEAALSRLYGGIHYRFDNEAGLLLGRQIGKTVLERAL